MQFGGLPLHGPTVLDGDKRRFEMRGEDSTRG
jgi:hypothetical protein